MSHRLGKRINGLPLFGHLCQDGPAGIAKEQHARDLVVCFPGRVVEGLAKELVVANPVHEDQLGVAAGNEESEGRVLGMLD